MPTVYTGKARGLLALGYYKGKENRRRSDVSENQTKSSNAYNSAMSAYNAYRTSKDRRLEKKSYKDSLTDDSGNTFDSAGTMKDYNNPSSDLNSEAFKNKILSAKRDYTMKTSQWKNK